MKCFRDSSKKNEWSGAPFPASLGGALPLESLPMAPPHRSSGTGNSCQHVQGQQSKQWQWMQGRKRATVVAAMEGAAGSPISH
eukprot:1161082-Pelagomonas_calceolata.AAC.9